MKTLLLFLFTAGALTCVAQQATDKHPYFVVLYTTGESWDTTKPYYDQKHFEAHSAHLNALRKNKIIVIGARYSDTGMIVIQAKDEAAAKAIVNKDIAVENRLFKTSVFPFETFYGGCVD